MLFHVNNSKICVFLLVSYFTCTCLHIIINMMAKKNIHIFISHSQYWCWMMILQGGRKYQMEFQSCSTDLVLCFEWYLWLVLHCSTNKLLDVLKVNYLMGGDEKWTIAPWRRRSSPPSICGPVRDLGRLLEELCY